MPWWAWVVGALLIFLVLAVIGYLMGPQGGRAITRQDQRIVERRALKDSAFGQSPEHNQDVGVMTDGAIRLAREDTAAGIPDTEALALAFEKMDTHERATGAPEGLGPWLLEMAAHAMDAGVLNVMRPDEYSARVPGFSVEWVSRNPGEMVRIAGVRDLYAWPT